MFYSFVLLYYKFYYILIGLFCLFYRIYHKVMCITNLSSLRKFEDTKMVSKFVNRTMAYYTIVRREKNTTGQTMIYRTLYRKQKTAQHQDQQG